MSPSALGGLCPPPWILISLAFGVEWLDFEGQMRKVRDTCKYRINCLEVGQESLSRSGKSHGTPLTINSTCLKSFSAFVGCTLQYDVIRSEQLKQNPFSEFV